MTVEQGITLAMALAFCAVHLFIARLRVLDVQPRSRWLSFAGGTAVAYVFLHIMPDLAAHGSAFSEATGLGPLLADSLVFTLALAGLALFYGAERATALIGAERDRARANGHSPPAVFWVHIAATSLLVLVVGYLLNHREEEGLAALALSFAALLLHFVTADFAAHAHHPRLYEERARFVLAGATLAGWAAGLAFEVSELAVGGLFAFVGGAIVLIALKEELPAERESRLVPFLAGAGLYAALVLGERSLVG
ncbi:MAG: hypothetical protein V2I27_05645 [Erythrobacter sp.]|jgi:hypothetical protein|nr:hypothetical protein [Erythrobacter sp.]